MQKELIDESDKALKAAEVELKLCCKDASENALSRIHHASAWIDYLTFGAS